MQSPVPPSTAAGADTSISPPDDAITVSIAAATYAAPSPAPKGKSRMRRSDTAAVLDAMKQASAAGAKAAEAHLAFLQRLAERLQRVGLSFPGVEVRWQDLQAEVTVPKHGAQFTTVLSALTSGISGLISPLATHTTGNSDGPTTRIVLDAGSGSLLPGRMCLLLGPPGAGKTTMLRILSGQTLPSTAASSSEGSTGKGAAGGSDGGKKAPQGLRVGGQLQYNGQTPVRDFVVQRSASYVSQHDLHFGEMTVEETLMFAAECLGPGLNKQLHDLLLQREAAAGVAAHPDLDRLWSTAYGPHGHTLMVELFARLLGIDHVMDTVVGNEMLKGISGGQKRRVTVGEMAVGFAQVMMLDEITNGLDSNSALAIVRSLRNMCQYAQATMCVSLLQPSPEVFDCFDDVMLLSGGRLVFLGPREEVVPFFAGLGLRPPPSKTDADFLQEVTASPAHQMKYRVEGGLAAREGTKWLAPQRLRQEFDRSLTGQQLAQRMAVPPFSHELQLMVLHKEEYALSLPRMWFAVLKREWVLVKRNKIFLVAGAVQTLFTSFLVSTTFIRMGHTSFNDANLFMSVMFFSLMTMFMGGFNFCPIYCQRLPVFYKQRDHKFYSALSYAVSCCAMRVPELLLQSSLWAIMVYFSAGFVEQAGRFFIFWLNLVVGGFYSITLFQLLGAITRHEVIAQGLGAVMLMLSVLASGFPIARTSIPGWWIWWYWADPMAWALRSMAVNELTSSAWTTTAAEFDRPDISMGEFALLERGFYTNWKWVWAGIGAVLGMSLLLLGCQVLALRWLAASTAYRPVADEEDEAAPASKNGGGGPAPPPAGLTRVHPVAPAVAAGSGVAAVSRSGGSSSGEGPGAGATMAVVELAQQANGSETYTDSDAPAADKDAAVVLAPAALKARSVGGSKLTFSPVVMAFKGINYFVPNPSGSGSGELQLLKDVSGVFVPGVLTSLMGASGAGKTTLMDVLAGRKTGGREEGQQLVNGEPKRMATFARVMGYVEQFDAHNPQATVEESLLFSAALRVPRGGLTRGSARSYVQEVMDVVELGPLAKHAVGFGGTAGGLSTEARKRLTIACELVANPSIVFLDEPTTGLDARAAGMVMRAVRNTVATGRTVVCTIHQPNREIMDYFDELLLLKPGGRVIFNAPMGRPNQAALIAYLEAIPGVPRCEPTFNPANYMLEVTSPDAEKFMGVDFAELWAQSEAAAVAEARLHRYLAPRNPLALGQPSQAADVEAPAAPSATTEQQTCESGPVRRYAQPTYVQLGLLVRRGLVSYWRNPAYNLLRFAVTIALGLALGTLYWGAGKERNTLLGVLDIMGALYTTSLFLAMTNCLVVMPVVASERTVFYRERASGMYGSVVFAMSQGIAEMPYLFVQSVVYVVITYCAIQFEFNSTKALWFWLFIWLNIQAFTFLGMGSMNLTPNMPTAVALTSFAVLLWNLFCGFLIYRNDIKPWWLWAYYFNPATFSIYGCITTQLGDLTDVMIETGQNQYTSVAAFVQDTFNYHYDMRGWLVLIMVAFIIFFRSWSYIGLAFLNFQVR